MICFCFLNSLLKVTAQSLLYSVLSGLKRTFYAFVRQRNKDTCICNKMLINLVKYDTVV